MDTNDVSGERPIQIEVHLMFFVIQKAHRRHGAWGKAQEGLQVFHRGKG